MQGKKRQKWYVWLFVGGLGLLAIPLVLFAVLNRPPKAIVTFTFDDASNTQYEYAFKLSEKYSIAATLFVPTEMVDMSERGEGYSWTMGWDKLREISAGGWELGSHTRTHDPLTKMSEAEVTDQLARSQQEIEQEIGIKPVSFSSPFGDFNDYTIQRVMEYYDYHVSWKGHMGRNPVMKFDPRYIGRFEVTNDMSAEQVCGELVKASESNIWLVLLFHGIVEENAGDYEITADLLDQIYACARLLDDQGVIRIETLREGARIADWRKNSPVAQVIRQVFRHVPPPMAPTP